MVAHDEIEDKKSDKKQGMIRVPTGRHLAALMKMDTVDEELIVLLKRPKLKESLHRMEFL
jgi:hypothetical protein